MVANSGIEAPSPVAIEAPGARSGGSPVRGMSSPRDKQEIFESVALPHVDAVYRFALHLCGRESDAEDLAQECMHQAYRKFHQFQPGTNCKAWLFRIARNAHIDRLRQKSREPKISEFQESSAPVSESEDATSVVEWGKLAADGEDSFLEVFGDEVNRHLRELPPEFRLAVVLCDVEQFSYGEIGEVLDCPVGTVRSRISRARSHLKEKLWEYARELGFAKNDGE